MGALLALVLGLTAVSLGLAPLLPPQVMAWPDWLGITLLAVGIFLSLAAGFLVWRQIKRHLPTKRGGETGLVGFFSEERQRRRGPRVVALGGGTGLSTLLRGLKEYTDYITAIVTVTDTGGSSGRLRDELGVLPPGDIRNCLVALADTEPLMEKLFQYRFKGGTGLAGHSFGNLFLVSMTEVVGDFELAIKETSRVLAVRGRVLPSTLSSVTLEAEYTNGRRARGETNIVRPGMRIRRLSLDPADCQPLPEAIQALEKADLSVLGPGSLYTSVITNILVKDIAVAIRSSSAVKVYVANVMTQPGETEGYTVADHVEALIEHGGRGIVDWVLANNQRVAPELLSRYRREGAEPVKISRRSLARFGVQLKEAPLLAEEEVARHDPARLSRAILEIMARSPKNSTRG
ncbi:MAG: YvcK family protein [Firmicutes bacterium]|nr:YvcK family protein [Bacillota bacterium]